MGVVSIQDYKKQKLREEYIKQLIAYYGYTKEQQEEVKKEEA